ELERIADHAAGIAKLTIELEKESAIKVPPDMLRMGEIAHVMIKDSIDAYLDWDADRAKLIFARDDEVDKLDKKNYRALLDCMIENRNKINSATYLLWTSHNLERIADRV